MDWHRTPSDSAADPTGLSALLELAQEELGGDPIVGTRFLHDAQEMLRSTREIEAAVTGTDTTLWVGFQRAAKFDGEFDVYRDITKQGTEVVAFGEGTPRAAADLDNLTWVALPSDPLALENQWFLIVHDPEPLVFVGFETSPESVRGEGDAGGPRKSWDGFVSSDARLVELVTDHLASVVRNHRDS